VADPAAAEAYLAPRHVIDVLRDFLPTTTNGPQLLLGPAQLLGTLRQLQPRLYSISSSQVGAAGLGCLGWCRQPGHVSGTGWALAGIAFGGGLRPHTVLPLHPAHFAFVCAPPCLQLEHPQRVQATVAVVRYTSLAADRLGVCSTFLSERLAPGQALPIYIHRNPDFRWAGC
jgi:sulfite reductase alpha subunit-like flavoprotein